MLFVSQQKYKSQVSHGNAENQAELWLRPQNNHLSKQMDLAFKIHHKQVTFHGWKRNVTYDKEPWNLYRQSHINFTLGEEKQKIEKKNILAKELFALSQIVNYLIMMLKKHRKKL